MCYVFEGGLWYKDYGVYLSYFDGVYSNKYFLKLIGYCFVIGLWIVALDKKGICR